MGRGLTLLKLSYQTSTIGLFLYWNLSDNRELQLALKHEQGKGSYSVVKEGRAFSREIALNLESEFDGEMKNTENAWKLERIAKEKGKKAIDTTWNSKLLHSQYLLRSKKLIWTYIAPIIGSELPGLRRRPKCLLLLHKIRSSSLEIFRLVFFLMG